MTVKSEHLLALFSSRRPAGHATRRRLGACLPTLESLDVSFGWQDRAGHRGVRRHRRRDRPRLARPGRSRGAVGHAAGRRWRAWRRRWATVPMSARPTCASRPRADALVAAAEAAMGPLDILVNNAGFTRDMLALRMKDEDWQAVLDRGSDGAVPPVARGAEGDAAPPERPDHRDRQRRRQHRQPGPGELRRGQGRADGDDQGAGAGGRQPGHHGEHRGARVHPDGDDRATSATSRRSG